MALVKRDDGQIHYEVLGKGEPLLVLRGLGRSSRYWLGYEKQLAKTFKVILVDSRGFGRTKLDMKWTDTIDVLADDCVAVLDHLKIKKSHIFGLSLGGMIALKMGIHHAARCRSLVIANSSSADYLGFRIHPRAAGDLILGQLRGRLHEAILQRTIPPAIIKSRGGEILLQWTAIRQQEPMAMDALAKQLLAAARFTIRGQLQAQDVPTLFLYGSMDGLVPTFNTKKMQALVPGSLLKVIKGASHEIQMGHETQLTKALKEFCLNAS